jgi:HAE1 family hydrophobic/amphiphilic exporter-1
LSPALCGVVLRHRGQKRGIMGRVLRGIDATRNGYANVVARLLRVSILGLVAVIGFGLAAGWLASRTPTGFLPDEDQGAFMAEVQLPDAASTNRTLAAIGQVGRRSSAGHGCKASSPSRATASSTG